MALLPQIEPVVSFKKDTSPSDEMVNYGQEMLNTHRRYLQMQTEISGELLALHREISIFATSLNFSRFSSGFKRLSNLQQQLQALQEQFLDIQQANLDAVRGLKDVEPSPERSDAVRSLEREKATASRQHSEVKVMTSSDMKSLETPPLRVPIRKPLPVPVIEKPEVQTAARKKPIIPVSFKPKVALEISEADSGSGIAEKTVKSRRVRLRHRLESTLFKSLQCWSEQASVDSLRCFRHFLSFSFFHVLRLRRKVLEANLDWAYPELRAARRKRIARGCYKWAVRFALDILRIGILQGRMTEWTRFHNLEVLDEALAQGRGVLLIGAHFGNWEVLCPALSERGYQTSMYVGSQSNPLTDEMLNETRRKWDIQTIGKGRGATMQMWDALLGNRAVGMLIDQDERKAGIFVNFFGKLASTSKGAAAFHLMHHSPVLLFSCPYVKSRVEIRFQPVEFIPCGVRDKDIEDLTRNMVSGLELMIRRYPEQYFWMHRRWRTRPPGDSSTPY